MNDPKPIKVATTIHVGFCSPDKELIWITDGRSLGDFYGITVPVWAKDLGKLIEALQQLEKEAKR